MMSTCSERKPIPQRQAYHEAVQLNLRIIMLRQGIPSFALQQHTDKPRKFHVVLFAASTSNGRWSSGTFGGVAW